MLGESALENQALLSARSCSITRMRPIWLLSISVFGRMSQAHALAGRLSRMRNSSVIIFGRRTSEDAPAHEQGEVDHQR